jgi:hypothetical protein
MPTLPCRLRPVRLLLLVVTLLLAACALAPPAAAFGDGPAEVAERYLNARGQATLAADPASVLEPLVVRGGALVQRETTIARGTARLNATLDHLVDRVEAAVTVESVAVDGDDATVSARVITTTFWHAPGGQASIEAVALDHVLSLCRVAGQWRVKADQYVDVLEPALLEAAGAGTRRVRAGALRLERLPGVRLPIAAPFEPTPSSEATAAAPRAGRLRYQDTIYYDRDAARAYADRYALEYNPTFVRFAADCCNFASQCARAGSMPMLSGTGTTTWWYDKQGTSSPGDDQWSASWPWVPSQMAVWAGRRIDWVSSVSSVSRGDFVYYDWTGDGGWDHVAVFAGTNSAGQKVVDAHTTDHYRVFWKLGTKSTKYKFARVRAYWVI